MSEVLNVVCYQNTDGGSECPYPQSRIHVQGYGKVSFWVYSAVSEILLHLNQMQNRIPFWSVAWIFKEN